MAELKWKPGDKVRLASGGPTMVVKGNAPRDPKTVGTIPLGGPVAIHQPDLTCQWFDKNEILHQGDFSPDSLVAASS
jgi:uncharacterized protein YodC (DUF2158 family)